MTDSEPTKKAKIQRPPGYYSKAQREARSAAFAKRKSKAQLERRLKAGRKKRAEAMHDAQVKDAAKIQQKVRDGLPSWRDRQKSLAKATKQLKKELKPTPDGRNPYAYRHHKVSSFQRMMDKGQIREDMQRAAEEIDRIYTAMTGGLMRKGMTMELVDGKGAGNIPLTVSRNYSKLYKPWADRLSKAKIDGDYPILEIVLDVVVDRRMCSDIDTERGYKKGLASYLTREGLLLFSEMAAWCNPQTVEDFRATQGKAAGRRPLGKRKANPKMRGVNPGS